MWTRSAKDKVTGLMTVVVTDYDGNVFFEGQFDNLVDAEAAGVRNERLVTNGAKASDIVPTLEDIFSEIDDDELLKELIG
jgi:hypothetical protein